MISGIINMIINKSLKKYIFNSTFWDKFFCFILGHKPYRYRYKNTYNITWNKKGGKRRGAGTKKHHVRHYREYCTRCGLLIKKR